MSRSAFDAKRLAVILVGGGVLFVAVGAYVISRQALPPTFIGETSSSTSRVGSPIKATREYVVASDAGTR